MLKEQIHFQDLGQMEYKKAWEYQEMLLQVNLKKKAVINNHVAVERLPMNDIDAMETLHHLLFVEHPAVYTLGKSGNKDNVLIGDAELKERNIQFFDTNRGGDITFHGAGQLVGYPILDLEKFDTDIGKYLRNLEQVIILTLAEYGVLAGRSPGETGVWIETGKPGKERKICAIGVRCSRWITMHGFALNVTTDLSYFNYIIPCGIVNKQVTSLEKEIGYCPSMEDVKKAVKKNFEKVFDAEIIE